LLIIWELTIREVTETASAGNYHGDGRGLALAVHEGILQEWGEYLDIAKFWDVDLRRLWRRSGKNRLLQEI